MPLRIAVAVALSRTRSSRSDAARLATAAGVGTPARCCAAADGEGVLHLIEPAFTSLLQQEWPDWRGARLPDALAGQIAAGTGQFAGRTIVVTISRLHNQLLLQGRAKSTVDTLGQSKLAVAKHFSEGRTHKEIAQMLGLAPATVRNYLASVHDRLGISSKAELANLLREHR